MLEARVTKYAHRIVKYIMLWIWLAVVRLKWHLGVTKRSTAATKRNTAEIFTLATLEVIACIRYEVGTTPLATCFLRKSFNSLWSSRRSSLMDPNLRLCGSQWASGLRHELLGLQVRIPLPAWNSVRCECCVLSCEGLCDGPIIFPEFYRAWCVLSVIVEPIQKLGKTVCSQTQLCHMRCI